MAENVVHATKRIKRDSIESWSSIHIKVVRHRHTMTINNFSSSSEENGEEMKSPTFSTGTKNVELEWSLMLYPKGCRKINDEAISLFLKLVNCNLSEIKAEYTLGVVNAEGKDINCITRFQKFSKGKSWGFEIFLERDLLFNKENNFLSDDKLTIFCEIAATVGSISTSGTLPAPQIDLVKDLEFMLENKEWCDVTLSTCGKDFPAHKFILIARSPVFRAMFQHDMVENKNNRVEITDIDDEALEEMLRYMYTGEVHKLKQIAPRLLKIAAKYQMDGLKIMCEKALVENLSHENAAETFILGDTLGATELMDQIKKFIVVHAAEVGKTPGFESMVRTHPHLALETFQACTK